MRLVSGEQPSRDFFSPVQLGCPRSAMHQWKKHKKLNTTLSTRGTLENVHHCFSNITFKLINSSSSLKKNNAVPAFGYLILFSTDFYDFISTLAP